MKAFGVFEGGGAKGYAHVGALQAIEGRGIHLKAVAGSSVGAVIALLIAAGFSADELINKIAQDDWIDRLNRRDWAAFKKLDNEYRSNRLPQVPSRLGVVNVLKMGGSIISAFYRHSHLFKQIWTHYGITDADGIRQWLNDAICQKLGIAGGPVLFRDLKIPLKVVAGDLLSGKMRVFGGDEDADINAVDAAVASASYPLFFQPFPFERSLFVDGGLLSNLPVWVFDEERQKQLKLTPTFGFRFVDVPLLGPAPTYQPPSSFPGFIKRLVSTSVFGGQAVGTRAIDEYYTFDLAADIDTLAFHEIKEKAGGLVETGRKGVAKFFDTQIGPSDPDDMEILLGVFCNFIVQALDRTAKQKLPRLRAFILIENSPDFVKVVYSANATQDADDRLKIRNNSPGSAECFRRKEPVLSFVPQISEDVRTNPFFKYEHAVRPRDVTTIYAVPIFADPLEWSKENPEDRVKPLAALVIDSSEDIRYLLRVPELEDRLATYAQICGEYLRGLLVQSYGNANSYLPVSDLIPLEKAGFFVSDRKARSLFQDEETLELVKRTEERLRPD